jgi:hypothetical protein
MYAKILRSSFQIKILEPIVTAVGTGGSSILLITGMKGLCSLHMVFQW